MIRLVLARGKERSKYTLFKIGPASIKIANHQHAIGARHLIANMQTSGVKRHPADSEPQQSSDNILQARQPKEEPKAEEKLGGQEIEKSNGGKGEKQRRIRDSVPRLFGKKTVERVSERQEWDLREDLVQTVQAKDQGWNGEAEPDVRLAKKVTTR